MVVGMSWVTDLFSSEKYKSVDRLYNSELDNSRSGLNRLMELTEQLDKISHDARNHEDFLALITDSLEISIWVKDINSHFLYLNKSCAKNILKTTVEEAMSLTDADFKNDVLAPVCMESDGVVLNSLRSCRFIEHARYPDRDLWIDVTKLPLFTGETLVGVLGAAKDITESVPIEIRNKFSKAGYKEIDVNMCYCTGREYERRKESLVKLLEEDD